jgi:ankyrin repeat protein
MKRKAIYLLLLCAASVYGNTPKSILLIAGKPSHGEGEHEFPSGCDILARSLNESGLPVNAAVHYESWPNAGQLESADAVVVYCDGNDGHILRGHEADLLDLAQRETGIVFLHYALDGLSGELDDVLLTVLGGYYHDGKSANPLWTLKDPQITEHPVTFGVRPFELEDEYYYNLQFGDITPLLRAVPPEEQEPHILAWAFKSNRFAFTGGHFHRSWAHPDFRKLVLNGIVWSAGVEVPADGVASENPVITRNKTILHAIARNDPEDVRNHLLLGTDVNEKNSKGWTALHFATVRGNTGPAKVLVEAGALLDEPTGTLKTPLHFAADRGHLDIVKLLVEHGANLSARDDEQWTPLHFAAEKDRVDVAAYLIQKGAEVDARSRRGGTPLHEASASAGTEMIRLLLDNGADQSIRADNGKTPLDYAVELGNEPAQALLRDGR